MIKHMYCAGFKGPIQMSDPTQEKYTSPNPSGSDDGQIPVEEEGRGVELSN